MQAHDLQNSPRPTWRKSATRAVCLLAAAISLAGCVVYPYGPGPGPRWHPWPGYYRY